MKLIKASKILFALMTLIGFSCGSSNSSDQQNGDSQETDRATEVKLTQYIVQGKKLYQTNCANCHGQNGEGLAQLYPPLAGSDYLMADLERAACIVKKGMEGEIVVNGVSYNQMMPGVDYLDPIEVAEVVTYISNSWGNEAGLVPVTEVTKWLGKCE